MKLKGSFPLESKQLGSDQTSFLVPGIHYYKKMKAAHSDYQRCSQDLFFLSLELSSIGMLNKMTIKYNTV